MRPRTPLIVDCRIPPRTRAPSPTMLARWAATALGARGHGHEMALQVVSPARMRVLNKRYRGKDKPTNVLAFPAQDTGIARPRPLGDVVICAAVLRREAQVQRKPEVAHWAHLVIHGTLHLAGYDHEDDADARRMERREVALLRRLGYDDPYMDLQGAAGARERAAR